MGIAPWNEEAGYEVTGTSCRMELDELLDTDGFAPWDEFETYIAKAATNLLPDHTVEFIGTGGGCSALICTDGETAVVLTHEGGQGSDIGVYRFNPEYPNEPVEQWLPEQHIDWNGNFTEDDYLFIDGDVCADDIGCALATVIDRFVTNENPFGVSVEEQRSINGHEYWATIADCAHFADEYEALDAASNAQLWDEVVPKSGITRVSVTDLRTGGSGTFASFCTQEDAWNFYLRSIGR